MEAVRSLLTSLQHLIVTAGAVWWRVLPRLLTTTAVGWALYQVFAQLAAITVDVSAWLSLALLGLGFVAKLSAIIISLRIAGEELRIREAVPIGADDPRDNSISHLISITLLPFLGIYAVFDVITDAANNIQVDYYVWNGLTFERQVLEQLNPTASGNSPWLIVGLIVGLYLARRLIEHAFDRTGLRPLGLLSALVESFFLLMFVLSGRQLLVSVGKWVDDRAFRVWLDYPGWGLQQAFARIGIDITAVLDTVGTSWWEVLWPGITTMVVEPLLWLAVAALVYGSQVLSAADMWRRGRTVAVGRRGNVRVGERQRRVALELQEAFFGDLNDKYLPTLQSLRLVLGVGATFLGAFVISWGGLAMLTEWLQRTVLSSLGGHRATFWSVAEPPIDLLLALVGEPLRWALLATAFHACLTLFQARALSGAAPQNAELEPAATAAEPR